MSKNNLKILFLSVEVAPIAKVGGLGDVAGALPKVLFNSGVDVRICLPFYGFIDQKKNKIKKIKDNIKVAFGKDEETISIWKTFLDNTKIPVYLIRHKYFNYKKIYIGGRIKKGDKYTRGKIDTERFSFFTRASLIAAYELKFVPNVVHAQDWHTALAGDYLKTLTKAPTAKTKYPERALDMANFFRNTKTLYTIHNLANQGITTPEIIGISQIDPNLEIIKADKKNGDINFMVQGILGSDLINTVSPRYSKEILHHYLGADLDNILQKRQKDLSGILNGIDVDFFNPSRDPYIYQKYNVKTIYNKITNKTYLQKKLGLPINKNIPLVGLVSRLVWQKGLELIDDKFGELDCQFIFLGNGQKEFEDHLKKFAKKYPDKVRTLITFDVAMAQQIYASSDIFIMPSRFEPCGLGQMIAMRYGTVPVVRATGGLADTVINKKSLQLKKANGFTFTQYNSDNFYHALKRAIDLYRTKPMDWQKLQTRGMQTDFSWQKSAREYIKLYKKLRG